MKHKAVIFDLFGTLVNGYGGEAWRQLLAQMARTLGASEAAFAAEWERDENRALRAGGTHGTLTEHTEHVCRRIGHTPTIDAVRTAVDVRVAWERQMFMPRPDALPTLQTLVRDGRRLGLMSDCTPEVPDVFARSNLAPLFETTLFSCQVGLTKPDPRFYRLACQALEVPAEACVYVGDGAGGELQGAVEGGIAAVLIVAPHERQIVETRPEVQAWTGPRIAHLSELPKLLE